MRENWVDTTIKTILNIQRGGSPRPIKAFLTSESNGVNWIKIGDTKGVSKYIERTKEKIKPEGLAKSRLVKSGDFILSNSMSFGRPYIMKTTGAIHDGWLVLEKIAEHTINSDFLYHLLSSPQIYNQFSKLATGSTVKNLNIELVSKVKIPLPPLPEQRAIVTKLEALFHELDEGIASLQRAQDQLKIYRQAVLKKAFEGELTRAWREQQTDLPTAEELLAQIQAERERYYQQQLAEWEEAVRLWETEGKEGKKPRKPKFIDFDSSFIMHHREPNWQTCALDLVTQSIFDGPFGSKLKTSDYVDEGIRVIRLENISNLQFKEEKTSFVTNEKYEEIARHTVYAGDIIFSSFISTEISVAIVPVSIPLAINKADCFCIRPHDIILRKYLVYFLASRFTYSQLVNIVHGATRPRINTTQLKGVEVPLCSLPEQHQIVQEIESRLSVCDQVEKDILANLKRAERLRQSILQKAFAGELLTEAELAACRAEPDWEPAEQLLARIQKSKDH